MSVNFSDYFTGTLDNWMQSSAAPIDRLWYTESGFLKVQDDVSGKEGLILYKTPVDIDGQIVVKFNGLDLYNGTDNMVVFRYVDNNHFNFFAVQPGQNDDRGVVFGYDDIYQSTEKVELYNIYGVKLNLEIAPNKTIIPTTGSLDITLNNNTYDVVIRDSGDSFVASGTYVDSLNKNLNDGFVGFAHTIKWDANIVGWDSIVVNSTSAAIVAPTIESFSATDYHINLGESTNLGWSVTSGTETPTVQLGTASVGSYDTSSVSPVEDTTYTLSAWNSGGMDVEQLVITVTDTFPVITNFSNNGPISAGTSAILYWTIESGTSAYIDNGIGWIEPYVSAGNTYTSALPDDATFTITAYDDDLDFTTSSTTIIVENLPTVNLSVTGTPVCSGTNYGLVWETTEATSVVIDNGIGSVSLNGSMEVSSTGPVNYNISATNSLGTVTDSATAIVYYRAPIPYIGNDIELISIDGGPVSATLDGSNSYDPDGLNISYQWFDGATLLSTESSFIYPYNVGTTTVTLVVTDDCAQSASDTVDVTVSTRVPPVSIASVDIEILNTSGTVILDGSNSYDPDGSIVSYKWYYGGNLIGSGVQTPYDIVTEGTYVFNLVVTDNDGLTNTGSVTVIYSKQSNPIADAGKDQYFCSISGVEVFLDGSASRAPYGTTLTEFEWDLTDLNGTTVSGTVTNNTDISASVFVSASGYYLPKLTVTSNIGYTGSDIAAISVYDVPTITANNVSDTIDFGKASTDVVLSAFATAVSPEYVWKFYPAPSASPLVSNDQHLELNLGAGSYTADVYVRGNGGVCTSETESITIDIVDYGLKIKDFSLNPYQKVITDSSITSVDVDVNWLVEGATSVIIDNGIGSVGLSGTSTVNIASPGGIIPFNISASDGTYTITDTIYGSYIFDNITICKEREKLIKTLGIDELKYGTDRNLNLVDYLPEYVRSSQTEQLLSKFEHYLNNMFTEQRNYTWSEDNLEVTICDAKECNQLTSCNDIYLCSASCSGDCGNLATSAIENTYIVSGTSANYIATTPAESAGEIFINDMCAIKSDKISILDKIFRMTELFDPDLIPIDLIQYYAENLGYQAGVSRESIKTITEDSEATDLEQRRYLRFMVRNLPNWYQLKGNRSSVKIMMYSFGLIGDFVYYYTRNYSDPYATSADSWWEGDSITTSASGNKNKYEIADNRCALKNYLKDINEWVDATKISNGLEVDDWIHTDVDKTSLNEDLDPIPENKKYYSTPHFKLWIDILESTGDYSMDEERQKMIKTAVDAIKPINTVFDGVAVYWEGTPMIMYQNARHRVRKHIKILSDGTYTS